ncbi:MAG TPA: aromatic amino acid DMT transporter YddG [Atribacterota bacterium]|nr:aromatic amino acid DMT transporter YddG [Atribacterota bacterium]
MVAKELNKKDNSTLLGILAILFWGSTVAFSRSLTEQLGVVTTSGLVFISGGLLSWFYLIIRSPHTIKKMIHLPYNYLWGCGFLFVLYMISLYLAIGLSFNNQQVIEVSIINYLWPGLTLLFSVPILKKKAYFLIVPGTILSFAGVYIGMNPYHSLSIYSFFQNIKNNSLPYILAFIAALSWALYSNLARKWAARDKEGAVPIFLLITGLLLLILRIFYQEESRWTIRAGIELLYMAVFPTFLAYSFWDRAMRRGNILLVASLSYFTPLLSVFISSLYLHITIEVRLWIASLLVVAGAFLSRYSISDA